MQTAICCVPVSPLRAEPSHKSEMVSQIIFGEGCMIVERAADHWIKVKCKYDAYEGWCQDSHIQEVDQISYEQETGLTRKWVTEVEVNGQPMQIPLGSPIPQVKKGRVNWNKTRLQFHGKLWNPRDAKSTKGAIKKIAYAFLNTPYLWGGKTVFGTDCSGYTQTVFRFFDFALSRDAWQQALQGSEVNELKNAAFGDLAFFDNNEGRITHVGILLSNHKIIHASGKVRIDKISNAGIINGDSNEQTHKLKIIKRYF